MKPRYINMETLLNEIRALPDTPNGYSGTFDKAEIIAMIEDFIDTETQKEDVITIRPECTDCGEINRVHYYYEMAINSLTEAERQRDKAIHDRDLWEAYYMRAKLHPFKFLIYRIFNKPWLPFEPTMKRKFSRKDRE